jgi:glutaredoxin
VKTVKCSNCGGPIELATGTTCPHCAAPVSILSEENIKQTLVDLQKREEKRTTVAPDAAARIVQAQLEAQRSLAQYDAQSFPVRFANSASNNSDLVAAGAQVLVELLFSILG